MQTFEHLVGLRLKEVKKICRRDGFAVRAFLVGGFNLATADHRDDRVNVWVDKKGNITKVDGIG